MFCVSAYVRTFCAVYHSGLLEDCWANWMFVCVCVCVCVHCAMCMKTRCVGRWWYAEQCLPWCGPCASTTTAAAAMSASTWRGASSQTTTNPTDSVSPSACVCHLNWFKLNLVSSVFVTKYVYSLMCLVKPWSTVLRHLIKEFAFLYETRKFVTIYTTACHYLYRTRWLQAIAT